LVDEDTGVGEDETFALGASEQEHGAHGGADADAVGLDRRRARRVRSFR
jgi:hypothetical protein